MMQYIEQLVTRYPVLETVKNDIWQTYEVLENCFLSGNKLLVAGNGGSAADADHIVGELMKGFVKNRTVSDAFAEALQKVDAEKGSMLAESLQGALPAIALHNHGALNTAVLNDITGELIYAQQVNGYGVEGDVFLGISTSGNAADVYDAAIVARAKGLKVIGLAGKDGGKLRKIADVSVVVPEQETYKIQELHLPIYHTLCLMLEERFFN